MLFLYIFDYSWGWIAIWWANKRMMKILNNNNNVNEKSEKEKEMELKLYAQFIHLHHTDENTHRALIQPDTQKSKEKK